MQLKKYPITTSYDQYHFTSTLNLSAIPQEPKKSNQFPTFMSTCKYDHSNMMEHREKQNGGMVV